MPFEDALAAMRDGNAAKRPTFGNRQSRFSVTISAAGDDFVATPSSGSPVPWKPSSSDILATDWSIAV